MTLEQQLAKLSELGLAFDEGVTIDDALYSFDRKNYEDKPFDLVFFVLGIEVEREPWGRPVCSRVWNFDQECIGESGSYVDIVGKLCRVAAQPDCLKYVSDFVDLENGTAWLKYQVDGKKRDWIVEVNDDWADMLTVGYVMDDIERDGRRFYFKDNGQAMIMFYLDKHTANELNLLSNNALKLVTGE